MVLINRSGRLGSRARSARFVSLGESGAAAAADSAETNDQAPAPPHGRPTVLDLSSRLAELAHGGLQARLDGLVALSTLGVGEIPLLLALDVGH